MKIFLKEVSKSKANKMNKEKKSVKQTKKKPFKSEVKLRGSKQQKSK